MVLQIVSTNTMKHAPIEIAAGMSHLLSLPITILHICGTTSPTQPITPLTQTAPAVASVANPITIALFSPTLSPRVLASLSPMESTLSLHLNNTIPMMPMSIGIAEKASSVVLVDPIPPISQNVIAGSWLYGSATYFISDSSAEKIDCMIVPPSTSVIVGVPPLTFPTR